MMTRKLYNGLCGYLMRLLLAGELTDDQYAALQFRLDLLFYATPAEAAEDGARDLFHDAVHAAQSNLMFTATMPFAEGVN